MQFMQFMTSSSGLLRFTLHFYRLQSALCSKKGFSCVMHMTKRGQRLCMKLKHMAK